MGTAKTTIPNGKTVPLKLKLNGKKGRTALARRGHSLTATLTVVATNPQGESQTVKRTVTVKPAQAWAAKPKR